jgi:hypothetical protein
MRPSTLAEAVARSTDGPAPLYAHVNEFLDEFYLHPEDRSAMIADEPPFLADPRDNAWIGGVGEHLARRWRLPAIPAWTEDPRRFLKMPYFTNDLGPRMAKYLLMESPIPFRRRLVFTEAEPLRRARMPVEPAETP